MGPSSRPTLRDVAERAGVSYQTVSRVLNHPERVETQTLYRVRVVIRELGYEPNEAARALRACRPDGPLGDAAP